MRQGVGAAMRMMGEIFVMGRNIDEAIARMKKRENSGFTASFDMLGEAARTFPDAERYYQSYEDAIRAVGKAAGGGPFASRSSSPRSTRATRSPNMNAACRP